jgi:probable HAF family extracellular repeat protein
MQDLGTLGDSGANSDAFGINKSGEIAGYSYTDNTNSVYHAVVWRGNSHTISDLGTLGGSNSTGAAINSSGKVVGWSDIK